MTATILSRFLTDFCVSALSFNSGRRQTALPDYLFTLNKFVLRPDETSVSDETNVSDEMSISLGGKIS
jgi:hypothetical protein